MEILGFPVEEVDMEPVEIVIGEPLLIPDGFTPNIERLEKEWYGQWVDTIGHEKAIILYPDGFSEEIDLK